MPNSRSDPRAIVGQFTDRSEAPFLNYAGIRTERALHGPLSHDTFTALRGTTKHGPGMTIFGNKRLCIGNLPKRLKMSLLSRSSSIWQPSARRSPITSRIVGQAGNYV